MDTEIKGLKQLLGELSKLEDKVINKVSKMALEEASEVMLNSLKSEAPKAAKNSTRSYTFLNKKIIKNGGTMKAKMGINRDNWDRTKGLYFHYWGFRSHPKDSWMDRGYDSSKNQCIEIMKQTIANNLK